MLFRRHTIIYNLYHPWHTVALKPGININVLDETCETRLLYLGDSLFGELHRKNITNLPAPLDLTHVHQARLLHCDNNVPEMYIDHVQCTELNQHNVEIPVNLQTFVSPLDRTVFLQPNSTLFDPDYFPEQSVSPSTNLTQDTNTSIISEYSVTNQVKQEPQIKTEPELMVGSVLAEHSPSCQLRLQISNIISVQNLPKTPTSTEDYSTDSTIQGDIITLPAYPLDTTTDTRTNLDINDTASKEVTSVTSTSQDLTVAHGSDAEPSLDLIYQAGYIDESSAITIAPCGDTGTDQSSQEVTVRIALHNVAVANAGGVEADTSSVKPCLSVSTSSSPSVLDKSISESLSQDVTTQSASQEVTSNNTAQNSPELNHSTSHAPLSASKNVSSGISHGDTNSTNHEVDPIESSISESPGENTCAEPIPIRTHESSQDASLPSQSCSQDVTELLRTQDPLAKKRKEHLRSLGLSDSIYSSNSDVFYPVLTPKQDEVDYISFKDIIDTKWSVPLDNLSSNDIELEHAYLKNQITSSPQTLAKHTSSSSSSTENTTILCK